MCRAVSKEHLCHLTFSDKTEGVKVSLTLESVTEEV